MDTTRPLDNAVPSKSPGAPVVTRIEPTGDVASAQSRANTSPATVASSVDIARQLLDSGKAAIAKVDEVEVNTLKAAIASGEYRVEAEALADRLLEDVYEEL
ncbi:MAG: flagellar biosynthesis anti-sigma factor FlgM [Myxococcota bacterium]